MLRPHGLTGTTDGSLTGILPDAPILDSRSNTVKMLPATYYFLSYLVPNRLVGPSCQATRSSVSVSASGATTSVTFLALVMIILEKGHQRAPRK